MKRVMPVIRGLMARRVLINFRIRPEIARGWLPPPFRPALLGDWAMGGICLIRLERIRPWFLPGALGLTSENAAHRFAVEWDDGRITRKGVFIPRRDTDSTVSQLTGGRLFPGVHHAASFRVWETAGRFKLEMRSTDDCAFVRLAARTSPNWPRGSVFHSLEQASEFFEKGVFGWSPGRREGQFEGLELRTGHWRVEPLLVERVESSVFADSTRFPPGSVEFDCALLMRGVPHEWRALPPLARQSPARLDGRLKEGAPCTI